MAFWTTPLQAAQKFHSSRDTAMTIECRHVGSHYRVII